MLSAVEWGTSSALSPTSARTGTALCRSAVSTFLACVQPNYPCTACPAGRKRCGETGRCEEEMLEDLECCGEGKKYCEETKRCEWEVTYGTICSKHCAISYSHSKSIPRLPCRGTVL